MSSISRNLDECRLQVYADHAWQPRVAQMLDQHFGGKGEPVTGEMVAKYYGGEAARHWDEIAAARKAFFAAGTRHMNENGGSDDE